MSRVYIVIVNWNGWGDTIECLDSVFRNSYENYQVVVIDNGSRDGSLDRIRAWAEGLLDVFASKQKFSRLDSAPFELRPVSYVVYGCNIAESGGDIDRDSPLVLIRSDANRGFAGGCNVGLRYALARKDCDYVWLLNNDTVVSPDALTQMVRKMATRPRLGMCGSTLLYYKSPDRIQACGGGYYCRWIGLPWHYGRFTNWKKEINNEHAEAWINYVEGASMLVTRKFVEEVGLMCEDYKLFYEEIDWAIRAGKRYEITYAPESIVYHKVGKSIGTSSNPLNKSRVCEYFNVRNRLFFTRRYYPEALPAIYLTLLAAMLIRLACGKWNRASLIARTMLFYREIDYRFLPDANHE
jgi:GT2 family glycosyltransferase